MLKKNVDANAMAAAERAARLAEQVLSQADAMAGTLDRMAAALRDAHAAGVPIGSPGETDWVADAATAAATMLVVVTERMEAAGIWTDATRRDLADLATDAGEGTPTE